LQFSSARGPSLQHLSSLPHRLLPKAMAPPAQARTIAKDAYIHGFPLVDSYKTLYAQAVDAAGPDFKAPFNQIGNTANVFMPEVSSGTWIAPQLRKAD
jgi:hypothetical protein